MKKRKELDALVANGKRLKKGSGSCSAHELLKHDTDSSDVEDFSSTVSSRKSRKKSGNHLPLTSICVPLCQFVLVTMCILISGTLVWLHIGLREDLDVLRAHIQQVEAGNKNTPELIHSLHNDLQNLESNVSALFSEIRKNIADVNNATKEIEKLKIVTSKLQESVDAAPALKQLPKNVESVEERVVMFGSKISALESSVKELKDSQISIQSSTKNLFGEIDTIKTTIHDLANSTKSNDSRSSYPPLTRDLTYKNAISETKERVTFLENEFQDLMGSVQKLKSSSLTTESKPFTDLGAKVDAVNDAVLWVINDTHSVDAKISSLENYTYYSLAPHLDHIDVESCKCNGSVGMNSSELQNIVNKTIVDSVISIVNSGFQIDSIPFHQGSASVGMIQRAQNVLILLRGLTKQFSHMPLQEAISEDKAEEIFAHLFNDTCQQLLKEEADNLNLLVSKLKGSQKTEPQKDTESLSKVERTDNSQAALTATSDIGPSLSPGVDTQDTVSNNDEDDTPTIAPSTNA